VSADVETKVDKKPCASRHRRSSHTLTETMPILAQDFKVLNGCDWVNGKSGANGSLDFCSRNENAEPHKINGTDGNF